MEAEPLPFRLLGDPGIVHHALVHLHQNPASGKGRLGMIAQQVDVALHPDRLAALAIEVGRDAVEQEVGMVADGHKRP